MRLFVVSLRDPSSGAGRPSLTSRGTGHLVRHDGAS